MCQAAWGCPAAYWCSIQCPSFLSSILDSFCCCAFNNLILLLILHSVFCLQKFDTALLFLYLLCLSLTCSFFSLHCFHNIIEIVNKNIKTAIIYVILWFFKIDFFFSFWVIFLLLYMLSNFLLDVNFTLLGVGVLCVCLLYSWALF